MNSVPAPETRSAVPIVWALEAVVWLVLALCAVAAMLSTISADFPARSQALVGETIVVVASLGLGLWAWRRVLGDARAGGWAVAAALLRVVGLAPVLAFALVVSAAGFAA